MGPMLTVARCALALTLLAGGVPGPRGVTGLGSRSAHVLPAVEHDLIVALEDIRAGRLEKALNRVELAVEVQPRFELAQLVKGDVLSALGSPLTSLGNVSGQEEALGGLRAEAQARWRRAAHPPPRSFVPASIVRVPRSTSRLVLVDTEGYRLYLFEVHSGEIRPVADFYVSIGKAGTDKRREGDERTPTGVYRIASYLPGERLPDLYGSGALPLDYPNDWDRLRGRTGSGIWIHGTESVHYSRPPRSSRGCVTLSNPDFLSLRAKVDVGSTPVVLTHGVRWVSPASLAGVRASLASAVERWRRDSESRDADRLLGHYSESFRAAGMSREAFVSHQRRIPADQRPVEVAIEDLAIYRYPGEPDLALVEFQRRRRGDGLVESGPKRQYWRWEAGAWRIVSEG